MEAPHRKDIIKGMAELLKAHEEPYEEGSWDSFVKQQPVKKSKSYQWIGYAATFALILAVAGTLLIRSPEPPAELAKHAAPAVEKELGDLNEEPAISEVLPAEKSMNNVALNKHLPPLKRNDSLVENPLADVRMGAIDQPIAIVSIQDNSSRREMQAEPVAAVPAKPDLLKFLQEETAKVVANTKKGISKWDFGVEIAPTLLDANLSMGAGITTGYRISEHFSVSTGVSYVSLDAEERVSGRPVSLMSSKKLTAIDANIRAIDIPLALTYHLNKKLYTSVGVSYFNVLSEQRSNNYTTELEVSRTMSNPTTGIVETVQTTLAEKNIEPSPDQPLDGRGYLGFFNFSVGHVQPIFKNHKIVLEPFIKVPLGKLSSDDLKLSNGGVRLRYSF